MSAPSLSDSKYIDHWYQVGGIDVLAAPEPLLLSHLATLSPTATAPPPTATTAGRMCWPPGFRAQPTHAISG